MVFVASVLKQIPSIQKALKIPKVPAAPQPGADGAEITWVDVLGAKNPFKAHAQMRKAQIVEARLGRQGGSGTLAGIQGGRGNAGMRVGAPLPPPPPMVMESESAGGETRKATGVATANGSVSTRPEVVMLTARPKKTGTDTTSSTKKARRGGAKRKAR